MKERIQRLHRVLAALQDEGLCAAARGDLELLRATLEVQATRLVASHETWPRDERGGFATQGYVDSLLRRTRVPEPKEVHWILEVWGVPPAHWAGLTRQPGAGMIQEIWDGLHALMDGAEATRWMQALERQERLLEGAGGLASLRKRFSAYSTAGDRPGG